ncbi:hypothetical protein VTL71DRAFT_9892 [Oculimacula yallundae]|uniref:Uncharacterized protein n=1 Tax=Oculimacula yallundae TaxID=86028 RepID=A0ABR4BQU5_9HELO
MQSIIALSLALLTAVSATYTTPTASTTVQFTNDSTGRSANVVIPLDGALKPVSTLLDNTPLDIGATIPATSFFLQSNFAGVECDLYLNGYVVTITEKRTFAGFAPVASPVDLSAAQIACFKY